MTSASSSRSDFLRTARDSSHLDRQLLLQLGDRLRRLRQAQGLGTVEMAERVGDPQHPSERGSRGPRNVDRHLPARDGHPRRQWRAGAGRRGHPGTAARRLRCCEISPRGSRGPSSGVGRPWATPPAGSTKLGLSRGSRAPSQSRPCPVHKAKATTQRWLEAGDPRSASLWREWQQIMGDGTWRKALGRTRHAQQLRQASPLVTVLPEDVRQDILAQVSRLRKGVVLGSEPSRDDSSGHQR